MDLYALLRATEQSRASSLARRSGEERAPGVALGCRAGSREFPGERGGPRGDGAHPHRARAQTGRPEQGQSGQAARPQPQQALLTHGTVPARVGDERLCGLEYVPSDGRPIPHGSLEMRELPLVAISAVLTATTPLAH